MFSNFVAYKSWKKTWLWWLRSIIPEVQRLSWEDQDFKVTLNYLGSLRPTWASWGPGCKEIIEDSGSKYSGSLRGENYEDEVSWAGHIRRPCFRKTTTQKQMLQRQIEKAFRWKIHRCFMDINCLWICLGSGLPTIIWHRLGSLWFLLTRDLKVLVFGTCWASRKPTDLLLFFCS